MTVEDFKVIEGEWFKCNKAARILGIKKNDLHRMARRGEIVTRGEIRGKREYFIEGQYIDAYEERGQEEQGASLSSLTPYSEEKIRALATLWGIPPSRVLDLAVDHFIDEHLSSCDI